MPKGNFLAPMPFMGTPADFMLEGRMPMRTRGIQPPVEDPMADAETPLSPLAQNTPDNMGGTQVTPVASQAPMAPPPYMGIQQSDPMPSMEPRGPMSTGDQLKSWMGRPETGKALMSFAAGMLSGNGFNDGLARGLSGYQQTIDAEESKRGLTPAQIQELALKARLRQGSMGGDNKTQQGIETRMRYGQQLGLTGDALRDYALGINKGANSKSPMKFKDSMSMLGDISAVTGSMSKMNELMDLLTSVEGVAEGGTAPIEAALAKYAPNMGIAELFGGSTERGMNTLRWENIMSQEAITTMAETLKGATTNFELEEFKKILADKSAPNSLKMAVARDIQAALQRKAQILSLMSDPYASEEEKAAAYNQMRQNMLAATRPEGTLSYRQRWEQMNRGRASGGAPDLSQMTDAQLEALANQQQNN